MTDRTETPRTHLHYIHDIPVSEANTLVDYINRLETELSAARDRIAGLEKEREAMLLDASEWADYVIEDNAPLTLVAFLEARALLRDDALRERGKR